MQITIFGPTRVRTPNGAVVDGLGGVKPRQVLEILALSAGNPVSKDLLADLLWAGHPPRSHLGTLESYVCLLRRSLGLAGTRGAGIVTVWQGYLLDPSVIAVDLTTVRDLLRRAETEPDPATALDLLERALELARDDLLTDEAYTGWAVAERETVGHELVAAGSLAAAHALALGRNEVAIRHAQAALARDRLAEGTWRTLLRALSAAGRRSEALRAYSELREHLGAELGTDPCRETTNLYLDLLRADGGDDAAPSSRDEVRILARLLHEAVLALPGLHVSRSDPSWWRFAADLAAVG